MTRPVGTDNPAALSGDQIDEILRLMAKAKADRATAASQSNPSVSSKAGIPSAWLRVRFRVGEEDYRPITFPPPGPYWCSGWGMSEDEEFPILIAYVRRLEQITEFWPDADLDWDGSFVQEHDSITYSDRFPKPDWWDAAPGDGQ